MVQETWRKTQMVQKFSKRKPKLLGYSRMTKKETEYLRTTQRAREF
jgi:hypothetical protein